jgi:uncharacterized protein (TIGR02145 family)
LLKRLSASNNNNKLSIFKNKKNMNKNLVLAMLLLVAAVSAKAQVTIGAATDPAPFSVLELISAGSRGLRLPQMSNTDKANLVATQAFIDAKTTTALGLQIFNLDSNCVETWNGVEWISICPVIVTQSADALVIERDAVLDAAPVLSVTATNATEYQWYATAANGTAFTAISGATAATYTPNNTAYGKIQYKCKVSGSGVSVESEPVTLTYGCGAATTAGGWLTFQCFNLGSTVTATTDPFTPSKEINGSYYQWGRSDVVATANTPATWSSPGLWYLTWDATWGTSTVVAATAWNNGTENAPQKNTSNDPCPTGWRVPTRNEWKTIAIAGNHTTPNLWTQVGDFAQTSDVFESGYKVGADLFLPTTGFRDKGSGGLLYRGGYGHYWSSTECTDISETTHGYYLYFGKGASTEPLIPEKKEETKAFGFSVRCVLDN